MSWPIQTHPSTQMWILACICRHKLLYCTFMYACMHLWACSNPHTHIYTLWKSITISTPLTFSLNINILYRQKSLSSRETALTARTTFAYQRKFVQTHVNKNHILRPLPHHCTADTLHEEGKEQIFHLSGDPNWNLTAYFHFPAYIRDLEMRQSWGFSQYLIRTGQYSNFLLLSPTA